MPYSHQTTTSLVAVDGFPIVASDSANVDTYAGNSKQYRYCFLHNPSAGGTVRVLMASQADSDTPVTIYISQGDVFPLAVKRVYATTPVPPSGLIGLVGR